jgi:hypothetical protein
LKPEERRGPWTEIGFQGNDPATDFRGMGLLGLIQLVHFSCREGGELARQVLLDSNHNRRYYPFSATGINFTAFVLELLREGRLHSRILLKLDSSEMRYAVDVEGGPSSNEKLVDLCITEVHETYCEIFIEFYRMWVAADPPNIMSFPSIFKSVKERFRAKYVAN